MSTSNFIYIHIYCFYSILIERRDEHDARVSKHECIRLPRGVNPLALTERRDSAASAFSWGSSSIDGGRTASR